MIAVVKEVRQYKSVKLICSSFLLPIKQEHYIRASACGWKSQDHASEWPAATWAKILKKTDAKSIDSSCRSEFLANPSVMELSEDQAQAVRDTLRVHKYLSGESKTIDPRISNLGLTKALLGEQAIKSIILGLSRPITPNRRDAEKLISQWKQKDESCCFTGSVDELLSMKGTFIVAVSYRHDPQAKDDDRIFKMTEPDQQELVQSIVGIGKNPGTSTVIVWSDRVITTRLPKEKGVQNSYGWYNSGLLPYACLPVLKLSSRIPETTLEERIWIKAERSLGRLGIGVLSMSDARKGMLSNVHSGIPLLETLKSVSLLILSGYWPEDTGYWAKDYQEMKLWALGLVRSHRRVIELPLFEKVRRMDNAEILGSLRDLALVPRGIGEGERPLYTEDRLFFLKATAWNLSLEEIWNRSNAFMSHYLSRLVGIRFSWWINWTTGTILGFLVTVENKACTVLAFKQEDGFLVFRREGDAALYRHKEREAGEDTKKAIAQTALKCDKPPEIATQNWALLFCCDDCKGIEKTPLLVKNVIGDCCSEIDIILPHAFVGLTTCLFRAARATKNLDATSFVALFDTWNEHVKRKYDDWMSVRDTLSGPVWLEGYNEERVSFGFLDFISQNLFIGETRMSERTIQLPTKWEALQELRRVAEGGRDEQRLITNELYGGLSEQTCDPAVSTEEVARLMLSGAFTSAFELSSFLRIAAQLRGYWYTNINCKHGKMQIRFRHASGDVRFIQRSTVLKDFLSFGIVDPDDAEVVLDLAGKLNDDPEKYRSLVYWNDEMSDNASKHDMMRTFASSRRDLGDGRKLCLVDMTVSREDGTDLSWMYDPTRGKHHDELREQLRSFPEAERGIELKKAMEKVFGQGVPLPNLGSTFEELQGFSRSLQERESKAIEEKLAQMEKNNRAQRALADAKAVDDEVAELSSLLGGIKQLTSKLKG